MNPQSKILLEQMSRNQFGKALKEFLDIEMASLKDVTLAKSWDETLGRQLAVGIVEKLFSFMVERPVVDRNKNMYT